MYELNSSNNSQIQLPNLGDFRPQLFKFHKDKQAQKAPIIIPVRVHTFHYPERNLPSLVMTESNQDFFFFLGQKCIQKFNMKQDAKYQFKSFAILSTTPITPPPLLNLWSFDLRFSPTVYFCPPFPITL